MLGAAKSISRIFKAVMRRREQKKQFLTLVKVLKRIRILEGHRKTVLQGYFDELRSTGKDFGKQLRRHLKKVGEQKIFHEASGVIPTSYSIIYK